MTEAERELIEMLAQVRQRREERRAARVAKETEALAFLNGTERRPLNRASGTLNASGHQVQFRPSPIEGMKPGINLHKDGASLSMRVQVADGANFEYTVRVRIEPGNTWTAFRSVPAIEAGQVTRGQKTAVLPPANAHAHVLTEITDDEILRDFTRALESHLERLDD